jgi:hypothetical protein
MLKRTVVACKQTCHCVGNIARIVSDFLTTIPSAINEIELISSRGPLANRRGVERPDILGATSESSCNKEVK